MPCRAHVFKTVCKPSSVVYGHLSTNTVSCIPQRYLYKRFGRSNPCEPFVNLATGGVYNATRVATNAVCSYHALSALPINRRFIFCCTFLKVTFTGISPAPCLFVARTFLIDRLSLPPRPYNHLNGSILYYINLFLSTLKKVYFAIFLGYRLCFVAKNENLR